MLCGTVLKLVLRLVLYSLVTLKWLCCVECRYREGGEGIWRGWNWGVWCEMYVWEQVCSKGRVYAAQRYVMRGFSGSRCVTR